MKAKEFIEVWEEFAKTIVQDGDNVGTLWYQDAGWTRRVTGEANASEKESPLGDKLVEHLPQGIWRYRTEEWKLDLVLAKKQNWPTPKDWKEGEWQSKWDKIFWPTTYEIIVEHETSGGISWQEMVKLIHLRSRLKVLITYTYDVGSSEKSQKKSQDLIDETRNQFQAMLKAAWKNFPENWDTEYLLIVGQLDERGDTPEVKWHYTTFAPWGEKVCEHPSTEANIKKCNQ
ncbi:MAG: hypothetical protein IPO60_14175 [Flavobacteriales bacterium]|jgi:hypothetical protein|nr:hypothetical protein [Flavobacteriales bacterium]MBK6892023.1 hypothetical protein [Flavobacteriales bacterium]MBK7246162.1 hypothetical protein [Flavobacteriales bacterium]MBK9060073.1 hypothetical protein [Flavobacteriales bacterium]MBK9599425.1 hypothetical protein [Flavobacteriales bacterium]